MSLTLQSPLPRRQKKLLLSATSVRKVLIATELANMKNYFTARTAALKVTFSTQLVNGWITERNN